MERRTRMTIIQQKQIQASILLLPDQMSTEWGKHLMEGVQIYFFSLLFIGESLTDFIGK
jgi:hypothetical protein